MKYNKWLLLALAAIIIMNIVLLNKVTELDNKVKNYNSHVSSLENQIYNTVNSLRNSVSEELKKQNALVISSNYEYGDSDIAKGTVNVSFSVVPKEYTPDTTVYLIGENEEYPMILENGIFKTDMQLSIYDEYSFGLVKFVGENGTFNEKINLSLSPRYDFLPVMFAKYRGRCTSFKNKNSYEATYNGQITINLERKGFSIQAENIEMIEYLDGKETNRTSVPLNTTPFETQSADGSITVPEEVVTPYDTSWQGSKIFYYQLKDKKVTIPNGSVYEIYIELTDDMGLLHRMPVDTREISDTGMPIDRVSTHIDGATIYNAKTGEMLYQKTYPVLK